MTRIRHYILFENIVTKKECHKMRGYVWASPLNITIMYYYCNFEIGSHHHLYLHIYYGWVEKGLLSRDMVTTRYTLKYLTKILTSYFFYFTSRKITTQQKNLGKLISEKSETEKRLQN